MLHVYCETECKLNTMIETIKSIGHEMHKIGFLPTRGKLCGEI